MLREPHWRPGIAPWNPTHGAVNWQWCATATDGGAVCTAKGPPELAGRRYVRFYGNGTRPRCWLDH
jgi:hypothetical protein